MATSAAIATPGPSEADQNLVEDPNARFAALDSPDEPIIPDSEVDPKPDASVVPGVTPKTDVAVTPATLDPRDAELAQMRILARQQRVQLDQMQDSLNILGERVKERPAAPTVKPDRSLDDLDIEDGLAVKSTAPIEPKAPAPTSLQKLQLQLNAVVSTKGPLLDTLAEITSAVPAFADLATVCSKGNFDDIVHTAAESIAEEAKISYAEARLQVEISVWKQPNPYKYMYGLIKKYHPNYAEAASDPGASGTPKPGDGKGKTPAVTHPSIQSLAASADTQSGWTPEKIDGMEESELHKVPTDVYQAYLKGELDRK